MEWSMWIAAMATAVIAFYALKSHGLAKQNHELAQEIKRANESRTERDEEFRQQVSDLYRAIVVSSLVAAHGHSGEYATMGGRIKIFRENYKGETHIFD